jgi:putative acetyltransferase
MKFTIRPWESRDELGAIETIKEVYDEYGFAWDPAVYHSDLYNIQEAYFSTGDLFYVATVNDHVVGTVALEFFPILPGQAGQLQQFEGKWRVCSADCSLERLYVRPSARGFGVGSSLFREMLQLAIHSGRAAMEIWSDKRFVQAHGLYGKYGAEVVGERICDDPDVSPEWGLLLPLDQANWGEGKQQAVTND